MTAFPASVSQRRRWPKLSLVSSCESRVLYIHIRRYSELAASIKIKTFLQLRHEIPVFVRQIRLSRKFNPPNALFSRKNFAAVQGQGDGFLPGFFCSGSAGDGWMGLLA